MVNQTFEQFPETLWVASVQVATVWTNPESAREMDRFGTSNPTNMDKWIESLTFEQRVALCDENRVQTQLLYGEMVLISEVQDDWAHVIIPSQPSHKDDRGYPGWVPVKQLKKVAKRDWRCSKTAAVTEKFAWLETESGEHFLKISYQTQLPLVKEHTDRVEVMTPHGPLFIKKAAVTVFRATTGLEKQDGSKVVQAGEQFLGLEYFWGGMSSFGYDCSGFSYAMHKANGYLIPRDAGDQAENGEKVSYDQLLPGDLIFFAYEEGKGGLHHVGIYYGDEKMLHSPKTGKRIEIIALEGTVYERELCAATRYWHREELK
ncbi:gamma-D-glutamyl-L-lysine endopeptidase [Lentibacillus populi]|uniref:Gamma-D-glutamyl-L-lysine endopeptidase n=1 Tax=Lentibacillus populi TaxID=1827502 RepID=A0A9W5U1R2_9BACI|nr:C40 family peptidase [Lentibacillus populi]GGB62412.1 gamma-D-glutamyl-L-lysine endopeptidase [Lentibacillus populi]